MASSPIQFRHSMVRPLRDWRLWGILGRPTDSARYRIASLAAHTIVWAFLVCFLLSLTTAESLNDVIVVVNFCTTLMLAYIKAACLLCNAQTITGILDTMEQLELQTADRPAEQQCLRQAEQRSRLLYDLMVRFCIFGLTVYTVPPLIAGELMFPALYPFDWTASRLRYLLTFAFQLVCNNFIICLMPSIDTFGPAMWSFLTAYIRILRVRLAQLGSMSQSDRDCERQLHNCVRYHTTVLEVSKQINKVLCVHYLFQISLSSLLVCSTAVQFLLISSTGTPFEFMFLGGYLAGVFMQLLTPCYCASLVTFQSVDINTSAFGADWTRQSGAFKRTMFVLMERAKQPIVPAVYLRLVGINLDVVIRVFRLAYSMLTFLSSFEDL